MQINYKQLRTCHLTFPFLTEVIFLQIGSSVFQYLIDIKLFQPEVIFLQIGSNDISNRSEKVENVLLAVKMLLEILLLQGVFELLVLRPQNKIITQ
jgi:hypothetical protein